jgi:hypothetical protein
MLNCCPTALLKSDYFGWLTPESPEVDLWDVRTRLFRCPSCSGLWVLRSVCQGHQDWDQTFTRIASQAAYRALLNEEEEGKKLRIAKLEAVYKANGWDWKW